MKKTFLVMLLATVAGFAFAQSAATYDKAAVQEVMRTNMANMGALFAAAQGSDFGTAATKLMEIAQGMTSIMAFTPPKGSRETYVSVLEQFVAATYRAIGACGEKDKTKLLAALSEMGKLRDTGHAAFM